ncbi:MAG TPA: caspase family protein, partial [Roseiarcus sp.]|nr:caspase family protein [Roseiarcus sp.]
MTFERKVFRMLWGAALALAINGAAFAQQPPNPRIALVIGEAAYPDNPLATTANDAGLVAQTLQAAGFDVVGARDLDEKSLRQAFRDFIDKANAAGPDGIDFVYLSGRALQYAGDNYFAPVDARIARDVDVPIEAVKLGDFTHALAAISGRSHIIVIDGARANNYAPETPLAPGLALVDAEKGELIAYNAAPGTLAPDETGAYGVYGKDLAGALRQGGVPLEDIFAQVRLQVNQDTQGAVVPWSAANLAGPVYIFERAADTQPPPVIAATKALATRPLRSLGAREAYAAAIERDTLEAYREYLEAYPHAAEARRIRAMLAARREASYWRRALRENTPRAYWTYLRRYPNGPHVADASRRLAFLSAPEAPPSDFEPVEFADLPPPPPDEDFYEERPVAYFGGDDFGPPPPPPPPDFTPDYGEDWRDLPPPPPPREYGYLPVLPIAIPLIAGAVAIDYLHHERHERRRAEERNGVAPPGQPSAPRFGQAGQPPAPKPAAPPPLPKGVTVKAPPPQQQNAPKPLIPGTPGARPVSTAPAAIKATPPQPAPSQPAPAGGHAAPQPQPQAPAGHALPQPVAPQPTSGGHAAPPQPQAAAGR